MAKNIALMGAVFPDVPSILLPQQGGGLVSYVDVTDTTAAAADVASGKYFYTADGTKTQGTASGGGGSTGLEYEEGTYTPTSDIDQPTINFSRTHSDRPFFVLIADTETTAASQNSNLYWFIVSWYDLGIGRIRYQTSSYYYGRANWGYKTSSSASASTATITGTSSSDNTGLAYWLTNTGFKPSSSSTSRYWRSTRSYNWIAVWKPTT